MSTTTARLNLLKVDIIQVTSNIGLPQFENDLSKAEPA